MLYEDLNPLGARSGRKRKEQVPSAKSLELTYDVLMAAGTWTGREAELRRIIAEYRLDGVRLGGVVLETLSESIHESRLTPKRAEVEAAAYVLARLGYSNAVLETRDARGTAFERPDLDFVLDGRRFGFEVAFGIESSVAKGNAEELRIESTIRDLLVSDPVFREAFGSGHLVLHLESDRQPLKRASAKQIVKELIAFISARSHRNGMCDECFPSHYTTLHGRGASFWMTREMGNPYFSALHGSPTVDRSDSSSIVVQIINNHRNQAVTYRHRQNWFVVQIIDVFDIFRPTLARLVQLCPPIDPFEKVFVRSPSGDIILLEERSGIVVAESVAY